jgi:hypothetical protein
MARPRKGRAPKGPAIKAVNYRIIPPLDGDHEPEPYKLLTQAREKWHKDTSEARIALAWKLREKADKDGHLVLGRCVKCSDLNREFAEYDFIIVLNKDVWNAKEFDKKKKMALLDHEMCHVGPNLDVETGEHKRDDKGRLLFRTVKHQIEEFIDVVDRHGVYKSDLELFAKTLLRNREPLLFANVPPPKAGKSGPAELQEFHEQQVN